MTNSEMIKLSNERLTLLIKEISRGKNISFDRELYEIYSKYFLENIKGVSKVLTDSLNKNLTDFSNGKVKVTIEEINQTIKDLDEKMFKNKINNWSQSENNIVKSRIIQVKNFDNWTSKGGYLIYRTAKDDDVRTEHKKLDGLTLPVGHAIWKEISPRVDYNCRCTLIHTLAPKNVSDVPNIPKDFRAPGLAQNTFYSGKIFSSKHTYLS